MNIGTTRRAFLADMGMGFTGLALGAMLFKDGVARADSNNLPDGKPHFPPKAKSVIWIFMVGGVSHVESFDPKPELTKHAGKSIQESPYKSILDSPFVKKNLRRQEDDVDRMQSKIYPLQVGYRKYGQSGLEMSDWFPHLGSCADDLALVRSVWSTDPNHGAQLQFHTGRHFVEGVFPSIGAWAHYGLGALNENLPQFVVLGGQLADCCGGVFGHGAHYLGPEHNGVCMNIDPKTPIPFATPGASQFREEQKAEFDLLGRLNRLANIEYPDDPALRARIKSYELAFRMQMAGPEAMSLDKESPDTQKLYGIDQGETKDFGMSCLAARRLVERGVRFVQIFHGANGGAGAWDSHRGLKQKHGNLCAQVDKPMAGLIKDLKQRGLLKDTLVVWGTEFGRTPGAQNADGRDHHPFGFSTWFAGGGIKGGIAHGQTDELGFHAVENRHYVTDIHATVLHQLGLDPRKLEVPGRKRIELDFGKPIQEIIA